MRYYTIVITNAAGKVVRNYTSFPNGRPDLNALDIELDIQLAPSHQPVGNSFVRIWGISLQEIAQAPQYNGMTIQVYGGMQKGLPLANPAQAGLLVSGSIQQAFGNWVGTSQTLEFYFGVQTGSAAAPKNLVLNWLAKKPLGPALTACLSAGYPGYSVSVDVRASLIQARDEISYHGTLTQLAEFVNDLTRKIVGGAYSGVNIVLKEKAFSIYDGTTPKKPKMIQFNDLIGQPTYSDFAEISIMTVMRSDLNIGDYIQLPATRVTVTANSLSQFRQSSTFQGTFLLTYLRHLGRFRQRDAGSWTTLVKIINIESAA